MKTCISLIAVIFIHFSVYSDVKSVTLEWNIPVGSNLELVRTAAVRTFINRKLSNVYDERNIIDMTCYESGGDSFSVKGDFSVYVRDKGNSVFRLEKKDFSDFVINRKGIYNVSARYLMPNMRNIPAFPSKKVSPSETWSAPAVIVFDNFAPPVAAEFMVHYKLGRIEKVKEMEYAYIYYEYSFEKSIPSSDGRNQGSFGAKSSGTIIWDIGSGKPVKTNDQYKAGFLYPDGTFQNST